nr:FHA domain-containing protein [Nocardioides convexus]
MHARGLCYRDISFGNVFFDPGNGNVLICDNDNVGIDNGTGRVLGTPYFMAPEVVRDTTYRTLPNTDTDRHSLAVLLFYALFLGHPLEGARTDSGMRDAQWLMTHFGTDPLFCMHPTRSDNRPAQIVQQYWKIYPQFVRDLFVQAFVEGLDQPGARVTEGQWIKALDRLRDGMLACPACGTTNFWAPGAESVTCWQDGTEFRPPYLLDLGRRTIAVGPQSTIRSDHLTSGIDQPTVLARVRQHPEAKDRWGLHNASDFSWPVAYPGGQSFLLQPDRTIEPGRGCEDPDPKSHRAGAAPVRPGTRSARMTPMSLVVEVDGRVLRLDGKSSYRIGRAIEADVVLTAGSVSRQHAEIRRSGDGWVLVDAGSQFGTFADGQQISEQPITRRTAVRCGPPAPGAEPGRRPRGPVRRPAVLQRHRGSRLRAGAARPGASGSRPAARRPARAACRRRPRARDPRVRPACRRRSPATTPPRSSRPLRRPARPVSAARRLRAPGPTCCWSRRAGSTASATRPRSPWGVVATARW